MKTYFEKLRTYIAENPPDFGDGKSVLTLLYEAYADSNNMDDGTITEDFNELYRLMNGMTLTQMDIRQRFGCCQGCIYVLIIWMKK